MKNSRKFFRILLGDKTVMGALFFFFLFLFADPVAQTTYQATPRILRFEDLAAQKPVGWKFLLEKRGQQRKPEQPMVFETKEQQTRFVPELGWMLAVVPAFETENGKWYLAPRSKSGIIEWFADSKTFVPHIHLSFRVYVYGVSPEDRVHELVAKAALKEESGLEALRKWFGKKWEAEPDALDYELRVNDEVKIFDVFHTKWIRDPLPPHNGLGKDNALALQVSSRSWKKLTHGSPKERYSNLPGAVFRSYRLVAPGKDDRIKFALFPDPNQELEEYADAVLRIKPYVNLKSGGPRYFVRSGEKEFEARSLGSGPDGPDLEFKAFIYGRTFRETDNVRLEVFPEAATIESLETYLASNATLVVGGDESVERRLTSDPVSGDGSPEFALAFLFEAERASSYTFAIELVGEPHNGPVSGAMVHLRWREQTYVMTEGAEGRYVAEVRPVEGEQLQIDAMAEGFSRLQKSLSYTPSVTALKIPLSKLRDRGPAVLKSLEIQAMTFVRFEDREQPQADVIVEAVFEGERGIERPQLKYDQQSGSFRGLIRHVAGTQVTAEARDPLGYFRSDPIRVERTNEPLRLELKFQRPNLFVIFNPSERLARAHSMNADRLFAFKSEVWQLFETLCKGDWDRQWAFRYFLTQDANADQLNPVMEYRFSTPAWSQHREKFFASSEMRGSPGEYLRVLDDRAEFLNGFSYDDQDLRGVVVYIAAAPILPPEPGELYQVEAALRDKRMKGLILFFTESSRDEIVNYTAANTYSHLCVLEFNISTEAKTFFRLAFGKATEELAALLRK